MEKEGKKILVKFFGVFLLVIAIILLLKHDKNYFLLGLVVFAIALVVLIYYNLKKKDYCSDNSENCPKPKENVKKKK